MRAQREVWAAANPVVRAINTATEAIKSEKMPTHEQDAVEVHFMKQAVDDSIQLHEYRAQQRDEVLREELGTTRTLR